jgi:hypothetical protein
MPRKPKKHPREMTTDEAMEHLFGKRGAGHAKKLARSGEKPQVKGQKRSITKKPS